MDRRSEGQDDDFFRNIGAWVWLGEVPIPQEAIGGLIVIVGVAVVSQGSRLLARRRIRAQPA